MLYMGRQTKKYPRSINPVLYYLLLIPLRLYARIAFGLKILKHMNAGIKPPFIILSNHQSNIDAFISAAAIYPIKPHYVVGRYHFRNSITRRVFRLIGTIPKEQFYPDYSSILEMKNVIDRGEVLFVFPSGQSSYTGESTYMLEGIGKLIKRFNVPVLALHIEGAHLTYPKWNMSRIRRTEIHASLSLLLGKEDLSAMSPDDIYRRVCDSLYFNDYEWQRGKMLSVKRPRNAEGIEYILFMCPKCGAEFRMTTKGNAITCGACGYEAHMDEYGFLHGADGDEAIHDTPVKWARWQTEIMNRWLDENPAYVYIQAVTLYKCKSDGAFYELERGDVTLSASGLDYEGSPVADGLYTLHIDASMYPVFPHEHKGSFEAYVNNELYRFVPHSKNTAYKCVMLGEVLYKRAAAHMASE